MYILFYWYARSGLETIFLVDKGNIQTYANGQYGKNHSLIPSVINWPTVRSNILNMELSVGKTHGAKPKNLDNLADAAESVKLLI